MAHVKRNWKLFTLAFIFAATSVGVWWSIEPGSAASAQSSPPKGVVAVNTAQRDMLLNVLRNIGLDREAMVALNVSSTQAVDLIAAAQTWMTTNTTEVATRRRAVAQKRAVVKRLKAAIRAGTAPDDAEALLATALGELRTAQATYQQGFTGLRTALAAELSESQRDTWRKVEGGWGRAMPMAMVDLTNNQRMAYGKALRHYRLASAAADTVAEQRAADTAWETAVGRILTEDNIQVIETYHAYANQARENVNDALNSLDGDGQEA